MPHTSNSSPLRSVTYLNSVRIDGRSCDELRPFDIQLDPMGFALSSLIIKIGQTSVLCSVSIKDGVPNWRAGEGKGWLSSEYRLLPASTPNRQKRELLKLSGRTQEIQRLISRSLRAVLDMSLLGEKTFLIDCDVIQADAGTRTAAITGSWVALYLACSRLLVRGELSVNPLIGQVAAVSVGLKKGVGLLDLNYLEDSTVDVDLNVVMDSCGSLLEIQGTAEGKSFTREELSALLDTAQVGIKDLLEAQLLALENQG